MAAARESSLLFAGQDNEQHNLYWGDIHNHNECGLAKGSLERAIELARGHLDFWAATGHSWWHDMPELPGTGRKRFLEGFERHRKFWPKTRRLVEEATDDEFVAILGYEWHSSAFGEDSKNGYNQGIAEHLETYLKKYRRVRIIGHAQSFWSHISADVPAPDKTLYPTGPVKPGGLIDRLLSEYPNLYADLSAATHLRYRTVFAKQVRIKSQSV